MIKQISIGGLCMSVLAGLLYGVWYVTRLPQLTISEVVITGGEQINPADIKAVVDESLAGSYLGLIPKRFTWFYPAEQIGAAIRAVPNIQSASVERSTTKLQINFVEYLPYALWCSEAEFDCYYIDKTGYAFARAPEISGGLFVRYVNLTNSPTLTYHLVPEEKFSQLSSLKSLLEARGFFAQTIEIDASSDVYIILGDDSELKFSLLAVPEKSVEYLDTILASNEFADLKTRPFDYIDLRFGSKVYVKAERDQVLATSATSTASTTLDTAAEQIFVAPIVEPNQN